MGSRFSKRTELEASDPFMTREAVQVILECIEDIWKKKRFAVLVKEYLHHSLACSELCQVLEKCLQRGRDRQIIFNVALRRFEDEFSGSNNTHNCFGEALEEFRSAGDPFTDEVVAFYFSVQKHQLVMWSRELSEVPFGSLTKWICSCCKRAQREIILSMSIGTYIAIQNLDTFWFLVDTLGNSTASLMQITDLANGLEDDAALVLAVGQIKQILSEYARTIDQLSHHARIFSRGISEKRIAICQRIITHHSRHSS